MENIITKNGNEYVVLSYDFGVCKVILKEKYDGPIFNGRDVRRLNCQAHELVDLMNQLGF